MRSRKTTIGLLGALALVGMGVYRLRRQLMRRVLGLGPVRYTVSVRRDLRVAMPDGVQLATDHYAPQGGRLHPTLLVRTPYGRSAAAGMSGLMAGFLAQRFAERGYNVVIQDVRGRFDSGGEFDPFTSEAADARATLVWLEQQPWFNGVLGMFGPSYLSYTQWAAAVGAPLYLRAIVPVIGGSQLPVMGMRDRAFAADMLLRWVQNLDNQQRTNGWLGWLRNNRFSAMAQERALQRAFNHLPLSEGDRLVAGRTVQFYQDWLVHRDVNEPYWKRVNLGAQAQRVTAAVHLVGGWYDILLRETLDDYQALRLAGRWPHLTIGPWTHWDRAVLREAMYQALAWFDAYLKGDRRSLRTNPVRFYLMGENRWCELESWPPPAQPQTIYLHPGGRLAFEPPTEDSAPDVYRYDPQDPTPAIGGPMMNQSAGRVDNRRLEARSDVLCFTSQPLEKTLQVVGPLRLTLYVRSSLEYTDFFGRLCDVQPNGRSYNVCDGLLRLVPEVGETQPDGTRRIEVELWPTAYSFLPGHRLRLQVSSGAHPRWNRNPGTGEPLASAVRLLPADQQVYHDPQHPSALTLPVASL